MKKLFVLPLLLLVVCSFAQSFKPIAAKVLQAHAGLKDQTPVVLFSSQSTELSSVPKLEAALSAAVVLDWNAEAIQQLRAQAKNPVTVRMAGTDGQPLYLDLIPANNFSADFQVHLAATGEAVRGLDTGTHFWGIVQGDAESLVALSVYEQELIGMVATAKGNFVLGKIEGRTDKKHVFYREADLLADNPFECHTEDDLHQIGETHVGASDRAIGPDNCVRMFIETDYTLFQNKGSVANVTSYMTGLMSQVSLLYTNESVNLVLHDLYVWNVNDPYTGPSASNYLTQFRTAKNGVYNGDLAHLVGIHNLGGVAYLDVLCNAVYGVGYSSINATYSNVPTYSWTVEVMTHEMGHNLGSPHTHACSWNGNNTAIDGCGPTAGYSEGCTAALPSNGGTIMSYCHLVSGVGINFNNGFGPQPGDRIRNEVYNANCLNVCGGGGGCAYTAINTSNFETNFGFYADGGTDCIRTNNATYANSPNFSIQLRDNTNTSVMTTANQNWTSYDEITVDFSYITVSFETGEDFWVQISTNGGSTYTTIGDFNAGTQFSNGVRAAGNVVIPGPFTSTTRLRFRADASADDDQVYIDDVVVTGCLQGANFSAAPAGNIVFEEEAAQIGGIVELQSGPNPTSDLFNIQLIADNGLQATLSITDLAGRVVLQNPLQAVKGSNQYSIPVGNLANGLYIVTVRAGEDVFTQKMVVAGH